MTDIELVEACTRLLRRARDAETIIVCSEVLSRIATLTLPAKQPFDRTAYMRSYMRAYRLKQRNPFA